MPPDPPPRLPVPGAWRVRLRRTRGRHTPSPPRPLTLGLVPPRPTPCSPGTYWSEGPARRGRTPRPPPAGAGSVVNRCGGGWSAVADAPSAPGLARGPRPLAQVVAGAPWQTPRPPPAAVTPNPRSHHRDNYGPWVEPRPPSEKRPLCLVPWAPGTVIPTPQNSHHGLPSAIGAGGRTGGRPDHRRELGDPLRDPNRPREAGFVFDTICHAYLLADERRRLRDARDRPAVMDEGNSLKSVHSVTSPGTLRYPRTSSRAGTVLMLARG